jgi:hypothetical protein
VEGIHNYAVINNHWYHLYGIRALARNNMASPRSLMNGKDKDMTGDDNLHGYAHLTITKLIPLFRFIPTTPWNAGDGTHLFSYPSPIPPASSDGNNIRASPLHMLPWTTATS